MMLKRKRTTDDEARIITNLVGQKDAIWAQLTQANERLAQAEKRHRELEAERDDFKRLYAAMQRDRDYFREQAGGNEL